MIPAIAIVGRPNVGKSTLFNRLTRSRDAIVADFPGVTRDRQYGHGEYEDKEFIVIDTGGIGHNEADIDTPMSSQSQQAMHEADIIFFMVDGRSGVTASDETIAQQLRQLQKPLFLVVNKTDGVDIDVALADFYALGLPNLMPVSASHGRGMSKLMELALPEQANLDDDDDGEEDADSNIKIAIIGKPNVGKSTLVNRMLGEERVVVFDQPGTTRDSISIPFTRFDQDYTLIDTAGIRRRKSVKEALEKFSVIKTLQAIEEAHVAVLVIDARENITDQDLRLLGYIIDAGRSLVIAINKWDGLEQDVREKVKEEIDRRLGFADFAKIHFISALHGTGVGNLYDSIQQAYTSAMVAMSTSQLTEYLQEAMIKHQPPLSGGRRIKLRYAHPGGHNPPIVVIHGNQTNKLNNDYKRYLNHFFLKKLKLVGTPVRIQFKTGENPYKENRNKLNDTQLRKRRRLMRFAKKNK